MTDEGKITMSEFKTVVERFEENQKKIVEVMQHEFGKINERFEKVDQRFEKVDQKFEKVDQRFNKIDQRFDKIENKITSLNEQVALLHEGQTAIRMELRQKPSLDMIEDLERRVTRLENKVA